ncbi:MAG TPA: hemerythrin family protein [Steroidobacteraceae bacterium]|nr:hemerythrin family protein [Steroidobacteraceae bacterium]
MDAELIEWREDFRIGLPGVDQEHRDLIDSINRLHRELVVGASTARVTGALGDIHAAISSHFALEEKDMQALRYAEFDAHKGEHERLLDEILDILDDVTVTGRYDPQVLSSRLAEWFTGHFRTFDARLHRWLMERQ